NPAPGFTRSSCNWPRIALWPQPRGLVVGVSPGEDLFLRQFGEGGNIPYSALFGKQLRQRGAAREATIALNKCPVNCPPRLFRSSANRAGIDLRPLAGALMMCIGPGENLLVCQ